MKQILGLTRRMYMQGLLAGAGTVLFPRISTATNKAVLQEQKQHWKLFEAQFISKDGRVVSDDDSLSKTYSEGQAYGLFFSLISGDQQAFERILKWTERNLCQGDISKNLPGWLWGKRDDGQWGLIDRNPASDADVWIAYSLIEAGRLWKNRAYTTIGKAVAKLIVQQECVQIPGLGLSLLPGPVGFQKDGKFKLNASYSPLQVLQSLSLHDLAWKEIAHSSMQVIAGSSPRGACADWVWFDGKNFTQDHEGEAQGRGGYNAIRVYLWAGIMHPHNLFYREQLRVLAPMAQLIQERGTPPEFIDPWTMQVQGDGPPGFRSAFLPFLQASRHNAALEVQEQALKQHPVRPTAYYEQCLHFFSASWRRASYAFDPQGQLVLSQSS